MTKSRAQMGMGEPADPWQSPAGKRIEMLERELAAAIQCIGTLSFAIEGVNPGKIGNQNIDDLVRRALDAAGPLTAAEARLRHLEDLPLCRRQLPDGGVPGNTEEALAAWVRTADDLQERCRSLQADLAAARERIAEVEKFQAAIAAERGAIEAGEGRPVTTEELLRDKSFRLECARETIRRYKREISRLRRALDAAGLEAWDNPPAPREAVEREDVEGG